MDKYLAEYINKNGVYSDFYDETSKQLTYDIDKIVLEKVVQNIYMCKKDEYKDFEISI
jgi:hypothetical protein